MCPKRDIVPAPELYDSWNPNKINTGLEVKAPDDGRAGDNQDLELRDGLGKRMRNCSAPANMTKPETVMAINQNMLRLL